MILQKPLATCAYGWGGTLKLYQDYLDVNGTLYALRDLMHVHALYRRVMKISSLRLELQFRERALVLRGIAVNESAERVVTHLQQHCPGSVISRPSNIATAKVKLKKVLAETPTAEAEGKQHAPEPLEQARAQETPSWLLDLAQDMQRVQGRQRRTHSLSGSLAGEREQFAQHLQADTLPSLTVPIPLKLALGEQARYCIEATLCTELLSDGSETPGYSYPAKDQGMLVLTNRRLIYMGRRGQRILGYARVLRVSRLPGAIAVLTNMTEVSSSSYASGAKSRTQRELFQVSRPLECALYLDHLLRQFYTQVATQHLAAVPGEAREQGGSQQDELVAVGVQTGHEGARMLRGTRKARLAPFTFSTQATEKIPAANNDEQHGETEGINAHSIRRSLADMETVTLTRR
jgi:hypothetical protein